MKSPHNKIAKLITCIECGSKVSSSASSCPGCNTLRPQGVNCILCQEVLKQSESTVWGVRRTSGSFHENCKHKFIEGFEASTKFEKVSSRKIRCPACEKMIERDYEESTNFSSDFDRSSYSHYTGRRSQDAIEQIEQSKQRKTISLGCDSCGHPISFYIMKHEWPYSGCFGCGKILVKRDKETLKFIHEDTDDEIYVHKYCYNVNQVKEYIFTEGYFSSTKIHNPSDLRTSQPIQIIKYIVRLITIPTFIVTTIYFNILVGFILALLYWCIQQHLLG
jgi:hypothetical protein